MPRPFHAITEDASFSHAKVITTSDATDLDFVTRGVYVGGAGNITAVMAGTGATCLFTAVPVGTTLRIKATRINATGTTATNLVALY